MTCVDIVRLSEVSQDESVEGTVRYGNWRLLTNEMTLAYDGNRHADLVLRTWIDLLAWNAGLYPNVPANDETGAFDRFDRSGINRSLP